MLHKSEYCEFGDNLGDSLRDRLVLVVCGHKSLTFDRAVDISVAEETATKDAAELGHYIDGAAIHKVQPKQNRIQYRKPCFRCARNGHTLQLTHSHTYPAE